MAFFASIIAFGSGRIKRTAGFATTLALAAALIVGCGVSVLASFVAAFPTTSMAMLLRT